MMTSKDWFSLVESEEKTKKHHHSHFLEVLICRFCVLRHLPSFSSALMRSRPSPSVTVKRSSGLKPNHSLATSNTTGSSSTTSMETLGTKSRRNWAKPPPPSPTRSTDTGPPERGDRTGAHLLGSLFFSQVIYPAKLSADLLADLCSAESLLPAATVQPPWLLGKRSRGRCCPHSKIVWRLWEQLSVCSSFCSSSSDLMLLAHKY